MSKQIFIRADGDLQMGLGHLYRTMALAEMLKDQFQITYICKKVPELLIQEFRLKDFGFKQIKAESDWIFKIQAGSLVVLDGYDFDLKLQKDIQSAGARLIRIDDIHDQPISADLLINHAPDIREQDYVGSSIGRFALGTPFALLRQSFIREAEKPGRPRNEIKNIFICFGGSDILNLSLEISTYLLDNTDYYLQVVLGASNPSKPLFSSLKEQYTDRLNLLDGLNEEGMAEHMRRADFGIVPSSSTLFECIACKLPVVSGFYVDNQLLIHQGLNHEGCFVDAGDYRTGNWKTVLGSITLTQLNNLIEQQARVIDGKSAERFNKLFLELAA
ncbi:MAG: UDP-2,4-diacetamido-2,4,6-trideoxy-beta-L-altropyranose hydrolase [Bacteroidia bacterium]